MSQCENQQPRQASRTDSKLSNCNAVLVAGPGTVSETVTVFESSRPVVCLVGEAVRTAVTRGRRIGEARRSGRQGERAVADNSVTKAAVRGSLSASESLPSTPGAATTLAPCPAGVEYESAVATGALSGGTKPGPRWGSRRRRRSCCCRSCRRGCCRCPRSGSRRRAARSAGGDLGVFAGLDLGEAAGAVPDPDLVDAAGEEAGRRTGRVRRAADRGERVGGGLAGLPTLRLPASVPSR